jgi:hypothetical protein
MNCKKCNCSCDKKMLHRTAPIGEVPANWMCLDCIREEHPELAKNIEADMSPIMQDLEEILL